MSLCRMGSAFFTGDNEGYVIAWDAENRKRLFEVLLLTMDCSHVNSRFYQSFCYIKKNKKQTYNKNDNVLILILYGDDEE